VFGAGILSKPLIALERGLSKRSENATYERELRNAVYAVRKREVQGIDERYMLIQRG